MEMAPTAEVELLLGPGYFCADVCRQGTGIHLFPILKMNRFLTRTLLFVVVNLVMIACLVAWAIAVRSDKARSERFRLPADAKYLVVGHSHPECAFNDSLVPGLVNLANSGEAYIYTSIKAQKMLAENPHIKTLFIEYSNNQVNARMDEWTWGDEFMPSKVSKYGAIMSGEEY